MIITRIIKNMGGGGIIDSIVTGQNLPNNATGFIALAAPPLPNRSPEAIYRFLAATFLDGAGFIEVQMLSMGNDPRIAPAKHDREVEIRKQQCSLSQVIYFKNSPRISVNDAVENIKIILETVAPYLSGRIGLEKHTYFSGKTRMEMNPRWKEIQDSVELKKYSIIPIKRIEIIDTLVAPSRELR